MRAGAGQPRYMRSAVLSAYAEAARAVEIEPFRMLRKVGLPAQAINHPDIKIPVERVQQLIEASAYAAERDDFGFLVGAAVKLSTKGPLGLLMREQPTIRKALDVLAHYIKYQNDNVVIRQEDRGDSHMVLPSLLSRETRNDPRMVEMTVTMYVQILKGLLGDDWRPRSVGFRHRPHADLSGYVAVLGNVKFNSPFNGIELAASDLNVRIAGADSEMAREISRYIEQNASRYGSSMSERVSELIGRLLPQGQCTVDQVAQHLGVDRRTVHRRLATEGKSFTQLVDETRREVVSEQLRKTDQPLTVVTALLGFSSLSTFSRWFRQTYGVRASEFRQTLQDHRRLRWRFPWRATGGAAGIRFRPSRSRIPADPRRQSRRRRCMGRP